MEPTLALPLLIGLIALALAFDFLNGLHDAANSIATVVSTRLLSPLTAVVFAAFFNFAAYFLSVIFPSLHKVAETIGKGIIDKDVITPAVVFGALIGAMFWNVLTWVGEGHPFLIKPCACRWSGRRGCRPCRDGRDYLDGPE
jgi:PiT family inorganic phosphate transporter